MELVLTKEPFLKSLQLLDLVVSSRAALPISSDVLIYTKDKNKCIFVGTDIETALSVEVECKVLSDGEICIPAKKLYEAVKELPENENIVLKTKDEKLPVANMICGKIKNTFIGQPAKNHPGMPQVDPKQIKSSQIQISSEILLDAFNKTVFATSKEETRYYLNGVFLNIQKDNIKFVATDGRRLAYVNRIVEGCKVIANGIVPTKSVDRVIDILKKVDTKSCKFSLLPEHFVLEIDNLCFVSRLVQGEFPAYEQVIPKINNTLDIPAEKLLKGIKQSSWVTTEKGFGIKFLFTKNLLKLSLAVESVGISEVELDIEYNNKDVEVKFEPSYILDMISVLKEKTELIIGLNEPSSPWTFQPLDDKGYLYILMPMKL
ncbi:MAG: DNA polymerase III subunit beta [Endomicrobiia bacterium]